MKLNRRNLDNLTPKVAKPTYLDSDTQHGIAHFGVGGFHRAHQAFYTDALMDQGRDLDWSICGIGLRPEDRKVRDDLAGEVVGAQVGTVFLDALNKHGGFKEVRSYDSIPDLMRDLKLGRIKAAFGDRPIIAYQLAQGKNPDVKLSSTYVPVVMGDVCLVMRQGDAEKLAQVNKGIAAIKADGSLQRIIEKWQLN